ncbi:MAG TPA: ABC transporter permease, partial [Acidimicrobiales bacterium]|nr:ABC transporter permease [Acidimicrobiales bacterium]
MTTTLTRKAWRDLSRRRTRTLLTVATIGLAIASVGMLAMPTLLDRTMNAEVRAARLYDILMPVRDAQLTGAQLTQLGAVPNVTAVAARVAYPTRAVVGTRRVEATVWGVADFAAQPIDTVIVHQGAVPGPSQLLGDTGNARNMSLPTSPGSQVSLLAASGATVALAITGTGKAMALTQGPWDSPKHLVLYATNDTVRSLSGVSGYNYLEFRVADTRPAALDATVSRLRAWLTTNVGAQALTDSPMIRNAGDWPGRKFARQISSAFLIMAALALLTSVFLIANTMNTLVGEQTTEIGIMKAVGGRRRQIAGVFLRAALILGVGGALLGVPAGIGLAAFLTRTFGNSFFNAPYHFSIDLPVAVASALVAVALSVAATVPALRRGLRQPVRQALQDNGAPAATFGTSAADRVMLHTHALPRPTQLGVRNLTRNKRRTASTTVQIALAVAVAVGMLGLGVSITRAVNSVYAAFAFDATVATQPGAKPLDGQARAIAASTPGVAQVDPVLFNTVRYRGTTLVAFGWADNTLYRPDLKAGRWFSPADQGGDARVVVAGQAVARANHINVGDTVTVTTASGDVAVKVIGIDR